MEHTAAASSKGRECDRRRKRHGRGRVDMDRVNAIAFDPYTHGYYKVSGRVGEAFKDGLKLKK